MIPPGARDSVTTPRWSFEPRGGEGKWEYLFVWRCLCEFVSVSSLELGDYFVIRKIRRCLACDVLVQSELTSYLILILKLWMHQSFTEFCTLYIFFKRWTIKKHLLAIWINIDYWFCSTIFYFFFCFRYVLRNIKCNLFGKLQNRKKALIKYDLFKSYDLLEAIVIYKKMGQNLVFPSFCY